jgi:hypothetical protein
MIILLYLKKTPHQGLQINVGDSDSALAFGNKNGCGPVAHLLWHI